MASHNDSFPSDAARPGVYSLSLRCGARTLSSVRTARTARALRCTFRTVEHLHHSESMMSRSGAEIPTASHVELAEREAASSAHWSKSQSNTYQHEAVATTVARPNESPRVGACQSVRVLYLIIFPRLVPLLLHSIHATRTLCSLSSSASVSTYMYIFLSLSRSSLVVLGVLA